MKPLGKVKIKWSPEFAYAIGFLVTDGCLYSDGRHIRLASKDKEQLIHFKKCFAIKNKIGSTTSGYRNKKALRVQFGDVNFYKFLLSIGVTPHKSKTIGSVEIPYEYFFDFLRGNFDGDGTLYSYFDPRWKSSFMFYTEFVSASKIHIDWIRSELSNRLGIKGHITNDSLGSTCQLKYAKGESMILLSKLYYNRSVICLSRKRLKIEKSLSIIGKTL